MNKFRNKYRIESNRLKGWNYSSNGLYFITIVTCGRELYFGEIISNEMHLNDFGIIALNEWSKSTDIRQEIFVDEFILMPNHLHAIVAICDGECFKYDNVDGCYDMDDDQRTDNDECMDGNERTDNDERTDRRDARPCVSTTRNTSC